MLPLLSLWAPRSLSQSPSYYGSSFSGSFPTGATAPVYRPWVRPLIPNLPPQQLRYSCIHRLVDPENIRSLTVAQLILCASALSDPQFIFFLIFSCYILSLTAMYMEQGNGQNMNLQSFWTGYFSGQHNGILADRFKESYQMLLGRVD